MIDKLKLYTDDYEIKQGAALIIQPEKITYNKTNEKTPKKGFFSSGKKIVFFDEKKKPILGEKAFLNNKDNLPYSVDIKSPDHLSVEFNPSKIFHNHNYYSITNQQLGIVCNQLQKDLDEKGIKLNINDMKVSRIDLAQNYKMKYPYINYSNLFGLLSGKRLKSSSYPSYYSFRNKSREVVFYDKLLELKEVQKLDFLKFGINENENILRNELRFKNAKTTKNNLELEKINQLFQLDHYHHLKKQFSGIVLNLVFNTKPRDDIVKMNLNRELELLQFCKENYKRNSLSNYFQMIGLDNISEKFGSLENFKKTLLRAGYNKSYVYSQIRELQKKFKIYSQVTKKYENENSISMLYDEVFNHVKKVA